MKNKPEASMITNKGVALDLGHDPAKNQLKQVGVG